MNTSKPGWKDLVSRRSLTAPAGIALMAFGLWLSGGDTPISAADASATCTDRKPGAGDYCASYACGPCGEGEGDCDPGQCADGLTCVEEGATDHCRAVDATCDRAPGAGDYCASYACGPCDEGEGDCDPGQCAPGLECVEEGSVDRCRPISDTCNAAPSSIEYCAPEACGPCGEGEGDCDPGECGPGLECVEEGSVDRCRPVANTCDLEPNAGEYCALDECGPCAEGQGDCDPGECGPGLECMEEGVIDRCRTLDGSCNVSPPDAPDYCEASACGLCGEGEGDCEPGQCGPGLECAEEGTVDRCRPAMSNDSNLQVLVDGEWRGICCDGTKPVLSDESCWWTEDDRRLMDRVEEKYLYCPEGSPADCTCNGGGERLHGINGGHLQQSVGLAEGGPVYPDYATDTCVFVKADGRLATEWTGPDCPDFRLK